MKKYDACIVGYYGMKNTGDDALLAGALWGAQNQLGAERMAITAPCDVRLNSSQTFSQTLEAQQRFRGQNRLLRYKLAFQSRQIVFGGGSVFHNSQDINIKRHMLRLAGKQQHMAVGVGLGPFVNVAAERACAEFLKRSSFTGLRDQQSYEIARAIAPDANIAQTFDLAPLLLHSPALSLQSIPRAGIAVNLCPRERLGGNLAAETSRIQRMAIVLTAVYEETGEPIYLVNLNGHETLGDNPLHTELKQMMPRHVPVTIVDYDPNPVRVLQRLASFRAIASMRLHGSILGFLAGTPQLSLNYHDKCIGWCEQVGLPQSLRFDATAIDVDALVTALVDGLDRGFPAPALEIDKAVAAAGKNWYRRSQDICTRLVAQIAL